MFGQLYGQQSATATAMCGSCQDPSSVSMLGFIQCREIHGLELYSAFVAESSPRTRDRTFHVLCLQMLYRFLQLWQRKLKEFIADFVHCKQDRLCFKKKRV